MRFSFILVPCVALVGYSACTSKYTDEYFGAPRDSGGQGQGGEGGSGGDDPHAAACDAAGLDCGDHGKCSVDGEEPVCVCDEGYAGPECGECADGYQDNDDDGTCQESCETNDCSGAGTCDDTSGTAVCACEGLRAGDQCERCTAGYELNGDTCEWVGGIVRNGAFDDDSVWNVTGAATINLNGFFGQLPPDALCYGGHISQELEMPPREVAEPMVLRFKAWQTGAQYSGRIAVRLGGVTHDVLVDGAKPPTWNNSICVGPTALGGTHTLRFQAGAFPDNCAFDTFQVDDVEIVLDEEGQCATVEGIRNGDFEDDSEWALNAAGVNINGGSVYFYAPGQCGVGDLSISQPFIVPTADQMPGAALRVTYQTGNGDGSSACNGSPSCADTLYLQLRDQASTGAVQVAALRSLETKTDVVCLPPAWRGSNVVLRAQVGRGGCAAVYGFDSRVDSIELIDEPGCAPVNGILDGDAESETPPDVPWSFQGTPVFAKVSDEEVAPQGESFLELGVDSRCQVPGVEVPFVTPDRSGDARAAIMFHYDFPDLGEATHGQVCTGLECVDLDFTDGWEERVVCVDPLGIAGGLSNFLRFQVTVPIGDGACNDAIAAQGFRIDDIRAGTHPSCQ